MSDAGVPPWILGGEDIKRISCRILAHYVFLRLEWLPNLPDGSVQVDVRHRPEGLARTLRHAFVDIWVMQEKNVKAIARRCGSPFRKDCCLENELFPHGEVGNL